MYDSGGHVNIGPQEVHNIKYVSHNHDIVWVDVHNLGHPIIYCLYLLLGAVDIHPATYETKKVDGSEVLLDQLYHPKKQVMAYLLQCGAVYMFLLWVIVVEDTNIEGYAIVGQHHMLQLIFL